MVWIFFPNRWLLVAVPVVTNQKLPVLSIWFTVVFQTVPMKIIEPVPDYRHHYLSHCDINNYLDSLEEKYPHLVQVKIVGHSFEKRILKSIFISKSSPNEIISKPMVVKRRAKSSIIRCSSKHTKPLSAVHLDSKQKIKAIPKRKPIIFIDGGMHAREWCTISTALHCASQLTDNLDTNQDLLDAFDFIIVPIVNPDGYEFSRTFVRINNFLLYELF